MDDLKKLQRNLEADQKLWATRKLELEEQIRRDNATLDVLAPKVKAASTELERVRGELKLANGNKAAIARDAASFEDTVIRLGVVVAERTKEISDLDELIASKQSRLDEKLADYTRKKEAEYKAELVGLEAKIGATSQELSALQRQADTKRGELEGLLAVITQERATAYQDRAEAEETLSQLRTQVPELQGRLEAVEKKFKQASYQLKEVQSTTEKARIEHQGFIDYESKARKLLATKDRELMDKQDELEVTARYAGNRRSNLSEL